MKFKTNETLCHSDGGFLSFRRRRNLKRRMLIARMQTPPIVEVTKKVMFQHSDETLCHSDGGGI